MSPRQATEKQLAALVKAREALRKKHTCERCGWEDPARGLQRDSDGRIYTVLRDGVAHRYCISCRLYFRWIDTRLRTEQELHALFEQHTPFYLIDLETTGKLESRSCQVVEVAIIDQDGKVLYHSLCKPDVSMPQSASSINGLTDDVLAEAPSFIQIWPELVSVLSTNTPLYAWNADFDREVLLRTAKRSGLPIPEAISDKTRWRCAMRLHARWYGEWSNGKNDYRWQPLAWASEELELASLPHHQAVGDALNTLSVLQAIATRNGALPPPSEMPSHERWYEE